MKKEGMEAFLLMIFSLALFSCQSVDVEKMKEREIREMNKRTGERQPVRYVLPEDREEEERARRAGDVNVITVMDEIFIPVDSQTQKRLTTNESVSQSMREALVTPENFIGGTQFFTYDEYKQFPVVTKVLGLTVIQLENNEVPIGVPYLSDITRWEVTGDVWRTVDGKTVQLVILKPLEVGLSTNMVLVTNRRIYQFLLSSTRDSYMPMVRFRYPVDIASRFITADTIRQDEIRRGQQGGYEESEYLSYNYKIYSGWWVLGWFKPDWTPIEAWDDGHKTFIRLPRGVLQMNYPVVFENGDYIVNYRVNENVMILDKLVREMTLRLDGKRVRIVKMKGEALDLRRMVVREMEIVGDKPPTGNSVRFDIEGEVPWMPEKVIEYDGETYIFFGEGLFDEENVLYIIDENRNQMEYRRTGNVIIIPQVIRRANLAYNNQMLTIIRR